MHTITAYHCDYCQKIYANRDSARLHERRCYYNPATGSCASCAFLDLLRYKFENGYITDFQVCMRNFDLTGSLKTGCEQYHQAEFHEEYGYKINIPELDFDKDLALKRLEGQIELMTKQHEKHIAEQKAAEEAMGLREKPEEAADLPW
jgi:hypothetical protein